MSVSNIIFWKFSKKGICVVSLNDHWSYESIFYLYPRKEGYKHHSWYLWGVVHLLRNVFRGRGVWDFVTVQTIKIFLFNILWQRGEGGLKSRFFVLRNKWTAPEYQKIKLGLLGFEPKNRWINVVCFRNWSTIRLCYRPISAYYYLF